MFLILFSCHDIICPQVEPEVDTIESFRNIPWINEFHYDNLGSDKREFVEIAAPADLNITPYILTLYNGYYGREYVYDPVHPLAEFREGQTINGITFYSKIFKPLNCSTGATASGLQNG
jgi:hypothetical protein